MTRFLSIILLLNGLAAGLLAQKSPPPPPPPLIYKAPETSSLKEFVAKDNSFKAIFPGSPTFSERKVENGSLKVYFVYREGSYSFINVSESLSNLEESKDKIYEVAKNTYLKNPKSKLESEKNFEINGLQGKEYSILEDYHYLKARVIIKENKVYELKNTITNWHIVDEKIKNDYFKETERFFDSFKLLK